MARKRTNNDLKSHKKRKSILIVLLGLFLLVGIPVIINTCYNSKKVLIRTRLDAADVLNYYGTVLGAAVTVGALIITILFTKKQIERDAYLERQREKWNKTQQIIMDAIDKNNPMRLFSVTIRLGDGDINRCVHQIQGYAERGGYSKRANCHQNGR